MRWGLMSSTTLKKGGFVRATLGWRLSSQARYNYKLGQLSVIKSAFELRRGPQCELVSFPRDTLERAGLGDPTVPRRSSARIPVKVNRRCGRRRSGAPSLCWPVVRGQR